jgi:steroid delta-isomerase-like uncharacterized protein
MATTPEQNKELVQQHYRTFWSDAPEEEIVAQLTPGFVDHAMPPGTSPGPEPVLHHRRMARKAFPDMQVTIDRAVAEGDRVAVHATWRGTHVEAFAGIAASGVQVAFTGMVFWRFEDGRIAERWAIMDLSPLRRAAGG